MPQPNIADGTTNRFIESMLLLDNNRSCACMVIYWGEWVMVPIRCNGAGASICVLHPCLAHVWVFHNDGSIDTCLNTASGIARRP